MSQDRADWLRVARDILGEVYGVRPAAVRVIIQDDQGREASFTVPADAEPAERGGLKLDTMHRKILAASTGDPQSYKVIARKAGYKQPPSRRVRDHITQLADAGLLVRAGRGCYRLG